LFYTGWKYDNKYTTPGYNAQMGVTRLDTTENERSTFLYLVDGWAFYDGFYTPEELTAGGVTPEAYFYIGRYGGFDLGDANTPRHGAGTYRMTVMTGNDNPQEYALELTEVFSRWNLWVNGDLKQSVGIEAALATSYANSIITFTAEDKIEIVVAVKSVPGDLYSGMVYPPAFGSPEAVLRQAALRLAVHSCASAVAVLLGLMCLLTWAGLRFSRPYVGMILLCLCFATYTAWPLFHALELRVAGWSLAERLCYYGMILFIFHLQGRLAGIPKHVYFPACGVALVVCLLVLSQPLLPMIRAGSYYRFGSFLELWKWLAALYLIVATVWALRRHRAGAGLLLAGFTVFAASLLSDRLWPMYEPIIFGWPQEIAGFILMLVFMAALAMDTVRVYRESQIATEQKKLSDAELESNRRYAALQQEYVTQSEKHLHETKGRYLMLRHYAEEGQQQQLLDELNRQLIDSSIASPRYSDNALLDAILHEWFSEADGAGVYVEYQLTDIPAKLPVEDTELTSLVTNILSNALRAAGDAEREKWLHITINWAGGVFTLHCANSKGRAMLPTKPGHGHGLSILRDIVERYNGRMETDDLGDSFEIHIRLSL